MKPDYSLALAMLAAMPHPAPVPSAFDAIPAWQRDPYQRRHGGGCSNDQRLSQENWDKKARKKKIAKASKNRNRK